MLKHPFIIYDYLQIAFFLDRDVKILTTDTITVNSNDNCFDTNSKCGEHIATKTSTTAVKKHIRQLFKSIGVAMHNNPGELYEPLHRTLMFTNARNNINIGRLDIMYVLQNASLYTSID